MWCFNLLLKSVKWRTNPHDCTITAAEPLICVCYRELELSSVFETIEGEGLSLHHSHLIGKATPHPFRHPHLHPKPPPLPVPQLPALLPPQSCSSPLSLHSVPATFDTTEHTVTAVYQQFECVTLHPIFMLFLLCLSRGIYQPAISLLARPTLQPAKSTSEESFSTRTLPMVPRRALMIFSCNSVK